MTTDLHLDARQNAWSGPMPAAVYCRAAAGCEHRMMRRSGWVLRDKTGFAAETRMRS